MAVEYTGSGLKGAVLPGSVHMLLILFTKACVCVSMYASQ